MEYKSLTLSFLNNAFYRALRNLRSRSEIMALGRPQSILCKRRTSISAHSSAVYVALPGISVIFRVYLQVAVIIQSYSFPESGNARIKSIDMV